MHCIQCSKKLYEINIIEKYFGSNFDIHKMHWDFDSKEYQKYLDIEDISSDLFYCDVCFINYFLHSPFKGIFCKRGDSLAYSFDKVININHCPFCSNCLNSIKNNEYYCSKCFSFGKDYPLKLVNNRKTLQWIK